MKTYILAIGLLVLSLGAIAQPNRDQIRSLKVAFITERLNLTPKEAQEFWPIYNAYDDQMVKIKFEELRGLRRNIKQNVETLSDSEAKNLLDSLVIAENKLHDQEVSLIKNLKKVISPQKILLLKVAEEDFNRKLFEQFRKRRQQRQ
ncbi:sensor of ECF-type sigma factor [Gaetbulibacter aestuarii]|uniref:Sensor of ECF-type sigma factor n=1 Tax=Gaetbulibacter aestuarii TaxID=1502358 RepID=A0ABW7MXE9_9FLAO